MFVSNVYRPCVRHCLAVIGVISLFSVEVSLAAPRTDRAPSLIDDARVQFELAYRLHPAETQARLGQLKAVVAAWQAAPQTDANNELLGAWLRAAIRSSMPGSHEPLPATPDFTAPPARQEIVTNLSPAPKPTLPKPARPVTVVRPKYIAPSQSDPVSERSLIIKPATAAEPTPAAAASLPTINDSDFDPYSNRDDSDPFSDDPLEKTENDPN